ncbi:flagellar protein FlaG protein [Paenibacillus mucilaginosus 3016]|uniref:Flagellar protein FlaG protein n=2 Tax=Paenibacillus mucilaginosus TaxID=61624 RepID=H6NLF4_9BACL|nr:flagellar protein FlaG [Paenibacillus mucilaginosus]AFC30336.1 flagellar protein FlaG protein [Paenibacillus mucilaginosus 3016]AFH62604.1 flagellar protein FlaG [Paenibacillus mucilaginosus K02]WFA18971.1 flagellar protein FlaG [Paenibacillus mucilaginosus]
MDMPISGAAGAGPAAVTPLTKVMNGVTDSKPQAPLHSAEEMKQAAARGEEISMSDEQVARSLERAIKAAEGKHTALQFSVHEQTKQIMVKVLDKDSGELIREVPSEKRLDFLAKLWQMAGILVDEKR